MKIAIPYDEGNVFQHFGHTEWFKVYETSKGSVSASGMLNAGGSGHGALVDLLKENGVDTLICGGIGGGAQSALAQAGIQLCGGVSGSVDEAIEKLLTGSLACTAEPTCDHHGEGEHHDAHDAHCGGKCHG